MEPNVRLEKEAADWRQRRSNQRVFGGDEEVKEDDIVRVIEQTLFRLRKNKRGAIVAIPKGSEFDDLHFDSDNSEISEESDKSFIMAGTIKELTAPDLTQQPLCITYAPLGENGTFELKSGLIHLLPTFNGLSREDPNKHLSDFHIVCSSMKPATVTDEQLKLRAFPFSLKDSARDWLYYLPPASIDTWVKMKKAFLEKYFPASRASQLKKKISNTKQKDYLVMYFCGGLCMEDARIVFAACGKNIVNKSPPEAWTIIGELAKSSRDFSKKYTKRGLNSVGSSSSSSHLEEKVDTLTSLFKDMMSGQRMAMACEICSDGHPSEHCPLMQEGSQEEVNEVWESTPQKKWNPYSNTFNPGWKAHPNFRWGNSQNTQQFGQGSQSGQPKTQFIPRPPVQNMPPNHPPPSGQMSTEDMIRALVTSQATLQAIVIQNQKENKASIQNIETQLGQMATTINRLEAKDSNVLPSQTVVNPKNVSAISLRNGRQLVEAEKVKRKDKEPVIHEVEEEIVIKEGEEASIFKEKEQIPSSIPEMEPEVPFPDALKGTHHFEHDKNIYEVFQKCELNIPLLNLLNGIPKYAKFLKELCTIKRNNKLKGVKKVKVSEHVSAIFQRKLPPKCSDPGMFTIPCTIGNIKIQKAMLDLGASINVMPYSLYESMELGLLHATSVVIQLADRSNVYRKGIVEDVLVLVDNLIFPSDFHVLDMEL
ncbi:uncharacterized protein LOC141629046 [Silene latifolia]|uniref:uncharacterized protein LOC141629046 n=1 Tax=Silene latifolia TaxID=37657 RepID=UPI003D7795DC